MLGLINKRFSPSSTSPRELSSAMQPAPERPRMLRRRTYTELVCPPFAVLPATAAGPSSFAAASSTVLCRGRRHCNLQMKPSSLRCQLLMIGPHLGETRVAHLLILIFLAPLLRGCLRGREKRVKRGREKNPVGWKKKCRIKTKGIKEKWASKVGYKGLLD